MRTGITIKITRPDRHRLEAITRDRNASQKHVWRANIVLLSADGVGTNEIMRQTGTLKTCVWRWQQRFMEEGVDGLLRDKTRPSRVPGHGPEVAERVVALTLADPPTETTHWTADLMARASGISASAVRRIWKAHGLQPHRCRQFKLSNDPNFVAKLRDVVLDGTVIGRNMQRHRHQELIRFLNTIEAEVPIGKIIHVILDNYAAHKHPNVRARLDRHPRFVFHFTPTSCSWLNAVEGFFAKLSRRRLKRGVFRSVVDLQSAINRFVAETNADPKPFTWTANPDKIIAAVKRGHQVLDSIH